MAMMQHNPPHPGEVLWGLYLEPAGLGITKFAEYLGVDRKTVSRLVNGRCGISAEMALRLSALLSTTPDVWMGLQQEYDLWNARKRCKSFLKKLKPLVLAG